MIQTQTDFFKIFEVFNKNKVDFIIVGGVGAVLHGAPVTTFDLDVVHCRSEENVERLFRSLKELNAYYRTRPDIRIEPDKTALAGAGHHLLLTDAGPLDLLGIVYTGEDYQDLLKSSEQFIVGKIRVDVQSLESLIKLKEQINREKDKAVIPILKQTLKEKMK